MSESLKILVTGGAGYIGSHTVIELVQAGFHPIVVDSFINSKRECLQRVEKIVGKSIECVTCDLLDSAAIDRVFVTHPDIFAVIHLAGFKAVGESVAKPLSYYRNNIVGALNLLEAMQRHAVHKLIFSSSATVYGEAKDLPISESSPTGGCSNPYGQTKFFIEQMLADLHRSAPDSWRLVILRYFNPVGSHPSGQIGEDPCGVPANLMPFVAQVAVGRRPQVNVFGGDFQTVDGTGVRDYIHVVDLAVGHVRALEKLRQADCNLKIYNLGTGRGYSVLEMIGAMEKAVGRKIPYQIVGRRAGDLDAVYASTDLAEKELHWKATRGLEEMCTDLWRWQQMNPEGFGSK